MGCHLTYRGITQRYLPHDTSEQTPPNSSQTGWYSIYLSQKDGRLSWPKWLGMYRDGYLSADSHSSIIIMKSKDLRSFFTKRQTSRQNNSNGSHFCSISCTTTSSDAVTLRALSPVSEKRLKYMEHLIQISIEKLQWRLKQTRVVNSWWNVATNCTFLPNTWPELHLIMHRTIGLIMGYIDPLTLTLVHWPDSPLVQMSSKDINKQITFWRRV